MTGDARDPGYFDALYAADADPWRFETSDYEREKYASTLAALPRPHYARAVEIGCSIGVLTAALADRCDAVLGIDVAQAAIDCARTRCTGRDHVAFARMRVPDEMPSGTFDLILLSEVLYYFDLPTLHRVAAGVRTAARPETDIVLVHWLGPTPDYPLTGEAAATAFLEASADWAKVMRQERTAEYRLDVLRTVPARR